MPSYETLEERVARSPHWRAIRAAYNPAKTYQNLTIFSPLLGTQHANVLRELLSYERAYDIMCRGEQRRGALYDRVVFSRLEFHWIGPHPPLASLQRDVIWAPPPDSFGMNDRHAVMPRAAAPDYFRRFSALISPQANRRFALDELVSLNPEAFLKMHLVRWETSTTWGRHLLGEMPLPAFLACCDAKFRVNSTKRCWAQGCEKVMVLPDEAVRTVWAALPKPELARARLACPCRGCNGAMGWAAPSLALRTPTHETAASATASNSGSKRRWSGCRGARRRATSGC